MRKIITEEKIVCDRCGDVLRGWEDNMSTGKFEIFHSSVIGDIFSEGAKLPAGTSGRKYFEEHTAVEFGSMPHQSLILQYGGDRKYHLCWKCNRDLLIMIGGFFLISTPKDF